MKPTTLIHRYIAALMLTCVSFVNLNAQSLKYNVTTLPDKSGYKLFATNFNNLGDTVGYYQGSDNSIEAFHYSYSSNTMTSLGNFYPTDINDSGEIVGYFYNPENMQGGQAISFFNGTITYLGNLLGTNSSIATAINNAGQIVGCSEYYPSSENLFGCGSGAIFLQGQVILRIGSLSIYPYEGSSIPNDICDLYDSSGIGVTVGAATATSNCLYSSTEPCKFAFEYANRKTFPVAQTICSESTTPSVSTSINNVGQITINCYEATDNGLTAPSAYVYDPRNSSYPLSLIEKGCIAYDINDAGQVVGTCEPGCQAFLFMQGIKYELQELDCLSELIALTKGKPIAINNQGQILLNQGLILTPTSETL